MLKLGTQEISGMYAGEAKIKKAYLGSDLVFEAAEPIPLGPQEFPYSGSVSTLTLARGSYRLEVWGAEGGYRSNAAYAGKGGYSVGTLNLTEATTIFIRVGGSGNTGGAAGGFNGGGKRSAYNGGGGASDIRIGVDDLNHRVIVAGGGGSDGAANKAGGYGGGAAGQSRTDNYGTGGFGGTQTGVSNSSWQASAPSDNVSSVAGAYGGFGFGGNGISANSGNGGAGGGGWYGGSGSMPDSSGDDDRGGAGGSGFVWTGANAPSGFGLTEEHYLTNAQTKDGAQSFASPGGTAETGHSGNGYARITPVVSYTVSVSTEDAEKGTVSGGGSYENGAQATVTATPTTGYKLTGWYENGVQVSTNPAYTFTVTGNRTLTAVFEVNTSRLPAGYTEVEYIQNATTSSYIDTGRRFYNSDFTFIFSIPTLATNIRPLYSSGFSLQGYNKTGTLRAWQGSTALLLDPTIAAGQKVTLEGRSSAAGKVYLNGTENAISPNTSTNIELPYSVSYANQIIRYYYMAGTTTRYSTAQYNFELIPCINPSGTVGFYDIRNNVFIGPKSGSFIAGPAV